jgi:ankyrin repeat protein
LELRADANLRDSHGQTPLFFAPRTDVCEALAAAGADPNARNVKGQTALHMAAHAGLQDVVQWLAERMHSGLLNAQDKHGRTAIYCAGRQGHSETFELLRGRGANPKLQPHKHWRSKPANVRQFPSPGALLGCEQPKHVTFKDEDAAEVEEDPPPSASCASESEASSALLAPLTLDAGAATAQVQVAAPVDMSPRFRRGLCLD